MHEDKHQKYYKLIVSFWLVTATYGQSTQNGKFLISLQCLKKKGDEVDCLHADKYQTLLQLDLIDHGGDDPVMPELPKITNLRNLCYISGKKWGWS